MRHRYRATVRSETMKPSFPQFAVDPGGSPDGILCRHASDESANLLAGPRPTAPRPGTPAPVETKTGAVPADDGLGFHDDEDLAPAAPATPECRPEESVQGVHRWPRPFAFEDSDLLSQGKELEGRVASTTEEDADGGEKSENEFGHEITLVTCCNEVPPHNGKRAQIADFNASWILSTDSPPPRTR